MSKRVALKIIPIKNIISDPRQLRNLGNEIKVHWALNECDGILQLLELYEDEEYVYLVLDFQEEGSLLDYIQKNKQLTENQTKVIIE